MCLTVIVTMIINSNLFHQIQVLLEDIPLFYVPRIKTKVLPIIVIKCQQCKIHQISKMLKDVLQSMKQNKE